MWRRIVFDSDSDMDSDSDSDDEVVYSRAPKVFKTRRNFFNEIDEGQFFKLFHLTKTTAAYVLSLIKQKLDPENNINQAVSSETQLLLALRYYAVGSMVISGDFAGVSTATASSIVKKVSCLIAPLAPKFIELPQTETELLDMKELFYRIASFPGVMAVLGTTHVRIQSPGGDNAELFKNKKGYYSLKVQVAASADCRISNIVARWPGSTHDNTIFLRSRLRSRIESGDFGNSLVLGGSAYTVQKYLLTPLHDPQRECERLYNDAHIETMDIVDQCFRLWKMRFPILTQGMRVKMETVMAIIVATAVLHNIATEMNDPEPPSLAADAAEIISQDETMPPDQPESGVEYGAVRRSIIEGYFGRLW